MVKKKIRKAERAAQQEEFSYGAAAPAVKKKRLVKLTRKQKLRRAQRQTKGEELADRRSTKTERDQRRVEKKMAAKALW